MKIILLLLISFNVSAMWRANIIKDGAIVNQGIRKTKADIDSWELKNKSSFPVGYTIEKKDTSFDIAAEEQARADKYLEISQIKKIIKNIQDPAAKRAIIMLFKDKYGE